MTNHGLHTELINRYNTVCRYDDNGGDGDDNDDSDDDDNNINNYSKLSLL